MGLISGARMSRNGFALNPLCAVIGLLTLCSPGGRAAGQCPGLPPKLIGLGVDADDHFGTSVAIDGKLAVIGAPRDPLYPEADTPPVYVYRFDGRDWIEEAQLTAPDGFWWFGFGHEVAADGDRVVVTDPFHGAAAYVFRFDAASRSWGTEVILVPRSQ